MEPYPHVEPAPTYRLHLPVTPIRATYALIVVNGIVFALQLLREDIVYQYGALMPALVIFFQQWWRLVTAGFLHGDVIHIFMNLYALHSLGVLTERFFGARRFLAIYFVSLLGSSVFVTIFSPVQSVTVGASGAVMGVLGALMFFFQQYREVLAGGKKFSSELLKMAVLNIGIGLLPGISLWGHLGGFIAGVLMGWALCPRYRRVGLELERVPLTRGMALNTVLMPSGWLLLLGLRILLARELG